MAAITSGADAKLRFLEGKAQALSYNMAATGTVTTAGLTSGLFTCGLVANSIGTTYPGTIVGIQGPPTTDDMRSIGFELSSSNIATGWLGWFYRFGTATLNSTVGNRLTHDGTFTRVRRTKYGVANTNIALIPLIYVTGAASVTQAIYTFGYADQDGNASTSPENRLPAAATNAQTTCIMMPLGSDSAVLDITTVTVTTATTGGTVSIFGFEPLMPFNNTILSMQSYKDNLYGGLHLAELTPATPDSGSFTQAFLGIYGTRQSNQVIRGMIYGINNT